MKGGRFIQFASNSEGRIQNKLEEMSEPACGKAVLMLELKQSNQLRSEIYLLQSSSRKQAALI